MTHLAWERPLNSQESLEVTFFFFCPNTHLPSACALFRVTHLLLHHDCSTFPLCRQWDGKPGEERGTEHDCADKLEMKEEERLRDWLVGLTLLVSVQGQLPYTDISPDVHPAPLCIFPVNSFIVGVVVFGVMMRFHALWIRVSILLMWVSIHFFFQMHSALLKLILKLGLKQFHTLVMYTK